GLGREVVMRTRACGPAMLVIVGLNCPEGGNDLIHAIEREEAFAGRQGRAKSSVLSDNRPAHGKIASAALTEPAAAETYVLVARHGELAFRRDRVSAVRCRIRGEFMSVVELPAIIC